MRRVLVVAVLAVSAVARAQAEAAGGLEAPTPVPVTFSFAMGRGVTFAQGEALSMNLRARLQVRESVVTAGEAVTSEFALRTVRLALLGKVLSPDVQYALQLAMASGDVEPALPSPVYDAYLEYLGWRDFNLRAGQFLVPFDRSRTMRDYALQVAERPQLVSELGLDRDLGVVVSSQDVGGLGGWLGYSLGLFSGQGKNRFAAEKAPGFLYLARVEVKPFGNFDLDLESDLTRLSRPRLAVGLAAAYNQDTSRQRSTTGALLTLGGFDYLHLAVDGVFKLQGFSVVVEAVSRYARVPVHQGVVGGAPVREYSRSAWGYLVQAGYLFTDRLEVVVRWDQLRFLGGDPALATLVQQQGREATAGLNVYLNGHFAKLQADWTVRFGEPGFPATHTARLALDVSL